MQVYVVMLSRCVECGSEPLLVGVYLSEDEARDAEQLARTRIAFCATYVIAPWVIDVEETGNDLLPNPCRDATVDATGRRTVELIGTWDE